MDNLYEEYKSILRGIDRSKFPNLDDQNDKYSGVFLPIAFKDYWDSPIKIMLVGRETAGWNTKNNKNKLKRIFDANDVGDICSIVNEATERYKKHLNGSDGKIKRTSKSHFKRYFLHISKLLLIPPESVIYANIFAWDYNNKSPLLRLNNAKDEKLVGEEVRIITSISKELLAAQIKLFKPNFIIFATGVNSIDPIIKSLFEEFFDGYQTNAKIPRKLWEFTAAGATCFRIAHPRAMSDHRQYRAKVIERIQQHVKSNIQE